MPPRLALIKPAARTLVSMTALIMAGANRLDCVVHQLAYGDLWSMFKWWPSRNDRGKKLEQAWNENLNNLLDVSFASLRAQDEFVLFRPGCQMQNADLLVWRLRLEQDFPILAGSRHSHVAHPVVACWQAGDMQAVDIRHKVQRGLVEEEIGL